jgi:hypothetical protein
LPRGTVVARRAVRVAGGLARSQILLASSSTSQYLEQFSDLVVSGGTIDPILGRLTLYELLHAW